MARLSQAQISEYRERGFIVVPEIVSGRELAMLRGKLAAWSEESRKHASGWGRTKDKRVRFDVEPHHSEAVPGLRRVNNPVEVSKAYFNVMADSAITDIVAELIGPDIKFHHSKINIKGPGSKLDIKFHQDFTGTPHTNTDIVTAMLMLDDMSPENGGLLLVPGSHREEICSVWRGDKYVAMVAPEIEARSAARAEPIVGKAGDVCFMSTLTLHGSRPNRSSRPRALLICVYTAADAVPIAPSPVMSRFEGMVVRGKPTRVARLSALKVELPGTYSSASFFDVVEEALDNQPAG
ncbi:MAG: phytanoyl-CoA dioxygenase family protein [Alphaproteobacteria bacterium]|nr:phytanoyl-CoA dioxygenase family protein [Alphaproteobacteria bacterium]